MNTDLFDRYTALDPVAEVDSNVLDTADLLATIDGRTTLMTSNDTISPRSLRSPNRALLAAAGVAVAVVAVVGAFLLVNLGGGESLPASPPPSITMPAPMTEQEREVLAVLDEYVAAYNSRDVHGMMALFAEDATWSDWGWGQGDVVGPEAISEAYRGQFNVTLGDEALRVSDPVVDGETVTYDTVWYTRSVGTWCGSETITVRDGRIVSYRSLGGTSVNCN